MKSYRVRACKALLLALGATAGASCIAWRGDLRRLDPDEFRTPEHPRELTFDVVYRANGVPKDSSAAQAGEVLMEALEETGLFASVTHTSSRGGLHIAFQLDENFNEGAVFASAFLCGFTFFVFPGYAKARYALEAELYDDGSVRSARSEDEMHLLMQILLLPATPFFWPPRIGEKLLENLARHAVHELLVAPQPGS